MKTNLYKIVVNGHFHDSEVRAVSSVHAKERWAREKGYTHYGEVEKVLESLAGHGIISTRRVSTTTEFDERVDWWDAQVSTALHLGLIHEGQANELGVTVDPPLDEEVLDYVLDNPEEFGVEDLV